MGFLADASGYEYDGSSPGSLDLPSPVSGEAFTESKAPGQASGQVTSSHSTGSVDAGKQSASSIRTLGLGGGSFERLLAFPLVLPGQDPSLHFCTLRKIVLA